MKPASRRHIRISVTKVAYDLICDATTDTGVARLTGTGTLAETGEELGEVFLTFWGSTTAQLRMRARNWPERFEAVSGDYFGVASAGEHRFDVFLAADRFFRLLDLAHGSRRAMIRLSCDASPDGELDLVHEMEISASRG